MQTSWVLSSLFGLAAFLLFDDARENAYICTLPILQRRDERSREFYKTKRCCEVYPKNMANDSVKIHIKKLHSKLKRTDYYDFGQGLPLMNVLTKTEDGKLDRIDTYIGVEGNTFVSVGLVKDLSVPGVLFTCGEYVRFQRANRAICLDIFKQNCRSHIIVDERSYTVDQFLKLS